MCEENRIQEVVTHKLSDYEYKSWSYGVPVPDGWERCPGDKVDVIRRLQIPMNGNHGINPGVVVVRNI